MEILKDLGNIIFSEYSKLIILFTMFIFMDLITGVCASIKENKRISSKIARQGFYNKIGSIMSLLFGFLADEFFKTIVILDWLNVDYPKHYYIGTMVSAYLCIIEGISILENLNRINKRLVPKFVRKIFENTEKKLNGGNENE